MRSMEKNLYKKYEREGCTRKTIPAQKLYAILRRPFHHANCKRTWELSCCRTFAPNPDVNSGRVQRPMLMPLNHSPSSTVQELLSYSTKFCVQIYESATSTLLPQ